MKEKESIKLKENAEDIENIKSKVVDEILKIQNVKQDDAEIHADMQKKIDGHIKKEVEEEDQMNFENHAKREITLDEDQGLQVNPNIAENKQNFETTIKIGNEDKVEKGHSLKLGEDVKRKTDIGNQKDGRNEEREVVDAHDQNNETHNNKLLPKVQSIIEQFSVINVDLFLDKLKRIADGQRTVYIASVDYSFVDMALNLFEMSFKKLNITNYIFICSHPKATDMLQSHGIQAVTLWNDTKYTGSSYYNSEGFGMKNIYKTIEIAIALSIGYRVLVIDVDIAILKDPKPYLVCENCDMIFQEDGPGNLNGGFYMSFPTAKSLQLHLGLINNGTCWKYKQQKCLNQLLKDFKLSVVTLNSVLFESGKLYFDKGHRMFAGDNKCESCVLIHNNWIMTFNTKKYRFKEHLLWAVDHNGYYSNENAKYVTFENNVYLGENNTQQIEEQALRNAFIIGHILNRIVILPKFFCYKCKDGCQRNTQSPTCAAHFHFEINSLDHYLENRYREHMFLQNRLVPNSVKNSSSELVYLTPTSKVIEAKQGRSQLGLEAYVIKASDVATGYKVDEFRNLMQPFSNFSVIKFHSLYGNLFEEAQTINIRRIISQGLKSVH